MAKQNSVESSIDLAAVSQLLGAPDKEQALGNGLSDLQRELLTLFLEKLRKEREVEQERAEQRRRAREQGARAQEEQARQERAMQESCPHMKPWGGPSIAGQRDHRHRTIFICLYCGKRWIDTELPHHLRIPTEEVGGPIA